LDPPKRGQNGKEKRGGRGGKEEGIGEEME